MAEINAEDVQRVVKVLPEPVVRLLQVTGSGVVVAGGLVRDVLLGVPWSDVDLFGNVGREQVRAILGTPTAVPPKCPPGTSEFLVEDQKVQYMNVGPWNSPVRWPEKKFDFTVCCACVWSARGAWKSWCSVEFLRDIRERMVCFNSRYVQTTSALGRVVKLVGKGLKVEPALLARVLATMVGDTKEGVVRRVDVASLEADLEKLLKGQRTDGYGTLAEEEGEMLEPVEQPGGNPHPGAPQEMPATRLATAFERWQEFRLREMAGARTRAVGTPAEGYLWAPHMETR